MVGSRNGSRKSGGYTDGAARSACGSARPPGRLARRPSPARVATFVPSIKASGVTSLSVSSTGIIDFLRPRRARTRQKVAVAARSRAGGAARCRFPTLESGSAVRVGSVAGRTSRRRRLVSGRRPQEAAEGARSCCSSSTMSTRVSRRRAASWSPIDTRESQRCSGTTCRRGGPGATARSGLLTTARGHRRSFLTSRRLRRESARRREKLRAPGLVCRRSFSTLYPTRRQRGRAVASSASFLGSGATARRCQIPSRDRLVSSCVFVVRIRHCSATPPPLAVVGGALDRASKMNHNTPNPVLAASRVLELSLAKVAEK